MYFEILINTFVSNKICDVFIVFQEIVKTKNVNIKLLFFSV